MRTNSAGRAKPGIGVMFCQLVAIGMATASDASAATAGAQPARVQYAEVAAHPAPLAALVSKDPVLAANKRLVFDLWRSVVDAGHVELADQMLWEGYIQHSPVLRTGRKSFKEIFSVVKRREIPELVEPPLVAMAAEGNLVVMVLRESVAGTAGAPARAGAHFNLFRVANGRLAEHWHSVQTAPGPDVPLPADGGPQPVTGATGGAQAALLGSAEAGLAANKRLVFDMWREVVDAGHVELANRYFTADFVEHSLAASAGGEGFVARLAPARAGAVQDAIRSPVVAVVAEGDLVVLVTMHEHPHPSRKGLTYTTTWFDMFRLSGGQIAEHWDAATP
jgi:predicted SnoaL-like aldol condensation-catalyzing enzyme